jgi:Tfp pilus assembly protein PilF
MSINETLALAVAHHQAGRLAEAEKVYQQVLLADPGNANALHLLGVLANQSQRFLAGFELISRAIAAQPEAEFYLNLGTSLNGLDRVDDAIAAYQKALTIKPDYAKAHYNLGNALHRARRWREAIAAYRIAIALRPDDAEYHWNLSLDLLAEGELEEGWKEYEWRWRVRGLRLGERPPGAIWDGGDLTGRTILLHSEQGFGDTMQFIRYVPEVAARGGKILLRCEKELMRLMKCVPHIAQFITPEEALPHYDFCCPLMTLPAIFKTNLGAIPAPIPYLRPDPELAAQWRARLPADGRIKVGLVWANKPFPPRCPRAHEFAPLGNIAGAWFCSLQKPLRAGTPIAPLVGVPLADWTDELRDFADTAALIDGLDLVIAVDTAVVHLAGAMGKPVWLLLNDVPDWRWLHDRADSPWYPTVRLFRQPRRGDWATPIEQITEALMRGLGQGR